MELLKKGQEVEFTAKYDDIDFVTKVLVGDGMLELTKIDKLGKTVTIPGFVVGDDEIRGFSVVALENPKVCLIGADPALFGSSFVAEMRERVRTGKYVGMDDSTRPGNPTCQFS